MKPKVVDTACGAANERSNTSQLDLKKVYVDCQPVFFNVLAKLSRSGFPTPPSDAFDHINEFLVSEWPGIAERFDATKGTIRAYVYGAFLRFARRRIARQKRWTHNLVSVNDLVRMQGPAQEAIESAIEQEDEVLTSDFLQQLPELHQRIFTEYVQSADADERALAKAYGLSRYRIREVLVESIGRISVAFGQQDQFPADHWNVLHSLWSELLTPAETAAKFGLSTDVVREIRDRHGMRLLANLRKLRTKKISTNWDQSMDTSTKGFLKRVFLSPGEDQLLDQLHGSCGEVSQLLSLEEVTFTDQELKVLQQNPQWIAKVYGAISGDSQLSPEEQEVDDAIGIASAEDDSAILDAILNHLLPNLPDSLTDWSARFVDVADSDRAIDEWGDFIAETSLSESELTSLPFVNDLLSNGLHPFILFESIHSIAQLAERLIKVPVKFEGSFGVEISFAKFVDSLREQRKHGELREVQIQVKGESIPGVTSPVIPTDLLVREISQYVGCSAGFAAGLLDWVVGCAQLTPKLFLGFETEIAGQNGIRLRLEERDENQSVQDLYVRLTPQPRLVESAAVFAD
ncbi:sigma-70 family RNA polymerase sigma factor [Stieleria mannarensis]|uniref:sigma-70 family RNA polymerase sigma factor n=1 Tax=Stieleria mannarensis TaxID=2755585 RepID=UPI0016043962|nr:sigma-70 family RNA polymerase sigma factor [Rhodopirellula sp. JC639]